MPEEIIKREKIIVVLPKLAAIGCLLLLPAYAIGSFANGPGAVFMPMVRSGPAPTPTATTAAPTATATVRVCPNVLFVCRGEQWE